jgi:hypothetical protein
LDEYMKELLGVGGVTDVGLAELRDAGVIGG